MKRAAAVLSLAALALLGCDRQKTSHAHYSRRLDDGVLRVVVIGDSLASGTGDESGQGIAGRLPAELRRRHSGPNEVQSFGAAGGTVEGIRTAMKEQSVRDAIYIADAVVVSAGSHGTFQSADRRKRAIEHRDEVARETLQKITGVVGDVRSINPDAEVLVLGGYNPIPDQPQSAGMGQYVQTWDALLQNHFGSDSYVGIVKISDILNGGQKLSPIDHYHPSGASYGEISQRIAEMIQ